MSLKRKFRFNIGTTLTAASTDFWVEYSAQTRDDGAPILGVILHGVWETVAGADGLIKREAVEARIKAIVHSYKGKTGSLDVARQDDGTWVGTGSQAFASVRLDDVSIEQGENNACLEYTLQFSVPILNGLIARTLIFDGGGSKTITAEAFLVLKSAEDTTTFKEVFRSGYVRIPAGPSLRITRVVGIRQALVGATDLLKRQNAESELAAWAVTRIGTEGTLTIDGTGLGTHHLRGVSPGELNLLDAMTFELEFVSNYGS